MRFTKKVFFYTMPCFIQSLSAVLVDIESFVQLIPGSSKSDKPFNITGVDKIHLECIIIDGSLVNGVRQPILYSFALDKPASH